MKKLVLSIHDVTPFFLPELKIIFKELDKLNIKKYNLLIVPNWDNQHDISKNEEFIELIKKYLTQDSKIVLHGLTHKSNKRVHKTFRGIIPSEVLEFSNLNEKEAEKRIIEGLNLIKKTFNVKPVGFVPPAWVLNPKRIFVIKKYFKYYTTYSAINYSKHKIKSRALCYTGGEIFLLDRLMILISSLAARFSKNKVVRLTIHPDDVRIGSFQTELKDIKNLIKKGYILALYEDFLEE